MGTSFERAYAKLMKLEGDYTPDDAGAGPSKRGITQRFLDQIGYSKRVEELNDEDIHYLYKRYWWDQAPYDKINSEKVGIAVFCEAVNFGLLTTISLLQDAVDDCGRKVKFDGILGPKTLAEVNSLDPYLLLMAFIARCAHQYSRIVISNPSKYGKLIRGWMKRLLAL